MKQFICEKKEMKDAEAAGCNLIPSCGPMFEKHRSAQLMKRRGWENLNHVCVFNF